jgi:hypothetical protein
LITVSMSRGLWNESVDDQLISEMFDISTSPAASGTSP